MTTEPDSVTRLIAGVRSGNRDAIDALLPLVHAELRRIASAHMRRERPGHTLQPTALVNEAWLKLQNQKGANWKGRTHGLALAAQAMRRLLVDHGRHQKSLKHGGRQQHIELDDLLQAAETAAVPVEDLLALETALTKLEEIDPRAAEIVTLRFMSGLSVPEVAEHLGVSARTVEADWTHARAWLKRELAGGAPPQGASDVKR